MRAKTRFSLSVAALLVVLCGGCVTTGWQGVCRHEAIYAGTVLEEIYGPDKVRIAMGPSSPTTIHAQAQVFIEGKWTWVHATIAQGESVYNGQVYISAQDNFVPNQYWTIESFEKYSRELATTRLSPEFQKLLKEAGIQ